MLKINKDYVNPDISSITDPDEGTLPIIDTYESDASIDTTGWYKDLSVVDHLNELRERFEKYMVGESGVHSYSEIKDYENKHRGYKVDKNYNFYDWRC